MDDADIAQERQEREDELRFSMAAIGYRVQLVPGIAGECDGCGEKSIRLVYGLCARCRDQVVMDRIRQYSHREIT